MKKLTPFAMPVLLCLVAVMFAAGPTAGQELPPGPTPIHRSTFEITDQPASFAGIQTVLDFAPGAWTPPHYHGGETLVLVLDGEMTVWTQGVETTYRPGESWRETPRVIHAAGNAGTEPARILVTFLLPAGAQLTTVVPTADGPTQVTDLEAK